jgi:cytochrome P450
MRIREKFDDVIFGLDMAARAAGEWIRTGAVFNPQKQELRADPYPFYRWLREKDPVHRSYPASGWVLTRYDDILGILADRDFSSDERHWCRYERQRQRTAHAGLPDPYEVGIASMLRIDPPDHTRLRTLVSQAFTPRAVERMRPRIESVVDGVLDGLVGRDEIELMAEFASPLPVQIIAGMLGVAVEDQQRFRHWSNEAVRMLGDGTRDDQRRALSAMHEMRTWLAGEVEARRCAPRDDLLSALVAAEDTGDRLTTTELFATCVLLLVAGNETTTNLIGNAVIALLQHPEQLELLRRQPGQIPAAIEELLRYDSPVQLTSRIALADRVFHGRHFRRGQQIVLLIGAGNRDPARFTDPDRLDVRRADVRPLSFGHGIHYCLGAQLARLETAIALERLLMRFPGLARGRGDVVWGDNTVLRGPRRLPLSTARAAARSTARPCIGPAVASGRNSARDVPA